MTNTRDEAKHRVQRESDPNMTDLLGAVAGKEFRTSGPGSWSVGLPIFQTTSFAYSSTEHAAASCTGTHPADCYTRYGNPNFQAVEEAIRRLEGAEAALVTGSGMGAISLVFLSLLESGDHVVAQRTHYAATSEALRERLPRFGIEVTQVDQSDPQAFEQALRPNTRLIYLETPANPLCKLTDLAAIARLGREAEVTTCVDSTLATPYNQRPIELGIDLVVHSATKYLGGHSDVLAGAVAGDQQRIDRLWDASIVYGTALHPFEAWLLARGLQTLPLRMPRHNDNALALARFLESHPRVERVHYPSLPSHPDHDLARRQMRGGGGLLSFEVAGGYDAAQALVGDLELVQLAVSLGGTKSLAVHVASMIYPHVSAETRRTVGVSENLIRVAVGLEEPEDLIADFDRALEARKAA